MGIDHQEWFEEHRTFLVPEVQIRFQALLDERAELRETIERREGGRSDETGVGATPVRSPFPKLNIGDQARCPKCGGFTKTVTWHPEREGYTLAHDEHWSTKCRAVVGEYCTVSKQKKHVWIPEHMHRRCDMCQYEWAEAPLDMTPEVRHAMSVGNKQVPVRTNDWELGGVPMTAILQSVKPTNMFRCRACGFSWTKWSLSIDRFPGPRRRHRSGD